MRNQYWAAAPIEEIAAKIKKKFDDYQLWLQRSGYGEKMRKCYMRYYMMDDQSVFVIERDGEDKLKLDLNHYRSLLKRMHIMTTENELAYQPKARNSDTRSLVKSDIGRNVLEYYGEEKDMHGFLSEATKGAIIINEMTMHAPWDRNEGFELLGDLSSNKIMNTGDQKFEMFTAFDAARNTSRKESPWSILRIKTNKYDLAALHPDFAEEILGSSIERTKMDFDWQNRSKEESLYIDDDDYTYKYILYHDRTAALPDGRWTEVCAGQVLWDAIDKRTGRKSLVYRKRPVVRLPAGSVLDTFLADSPSQDLLGVQDGMNALASATLTNSMNNAEQLIHTTDVGITTIKLPTGQTAVVASDKPTALNLNNTNEGLLKHLDVLMTHIQLLSGINDTARGNPQANVKNNGSMALMLAQAIQYVHEIQRNYAQAAGELGTIVINNLRDFGPDMILGYIAGDSMKGYVGEYKKDDLADIERVTVDLGNPITQSVMGRYDLAMSWAQQGIMKDPKQIEAFIRTGNLDQITEDDFKDSLLIRSENERLKRGQVPNVLLLDLHQEHILRHKQVLCSPEAREDPAISAAVLAHIHRHIEEMRLTPPDIAAAISGQPLPPLPGPIAPGGPQAADPTVNGAPMPKLPKGTPAQVGNNYAQMIGSMPQQQGVAS